MKFEIAPFGLTEKIGLTRYSRSAIAAKYSRQSLCPSKLSPISFPKKVHLSDEEWQNIADKTSVRFVIDSDAHSPDRVGDTKLADELLSRVSIPSGRIDNIDGRKPELRFARFKKERL